MIKEKRRRELHAEEPRYTAEELNTIGRLVEKEKKCAKAFRPGKEFSAYIKKLTR